MPWLLAAFASLLFIAGSTAFVMLRRSRHGGETDGRLGQLADNLHTYQQTIEARLVWLSERIGEKLSGNSHESLRAIAELKERLAVIDAAQKNITDLSEQMVGLQQIFGNKQARGAWGEVQLQDIVQTTLAPANYRFQATLGEGKRVDCLLLLPQPPGPIAVDAKFPLEGYRAMEKAQSEAERTVAKRDFIAAVRKHMRDIAEKYIIPGTTADSALMFVPSEGVYAEIHAHFTGLIDEAARLRVWIVSPTTLMATLTTIRAVMKDVRMREQAGEIQKRAHELVTHIERLAERVEKLQRHFEQAQEDLRQVRISTEKASAKATDIVEADLSPAAEQSTLLN